MSTMSLQEKIKKTVQLEEPDRVPVGILSSASTTQVFTKMSAEDFFSGPEKMLESEVKFMRMFPAALLIDGIRPEYGPEFFATAYGYKYKWLSSGVTIDQSSMRVEDIKAIDPHQDGLLPRVLEEWDYMFKHAPDDLKETWGDLLWSLRMPSPIHLLADMVGFRRLFELYYQDPQLVHEICEINCESLTNWIKAQKELFESNGVTPTCAFIIEETLGLTSPWIAEQFFLPYMKKITGQLQGFEIIRMHGDVDISHSWLPDIVKQCGINIYNFNFCNLRRLKATVGQHMCLEGNISSINVLKDGSQEDIEQAVAKLIATAGPGGGLIVSTGGGVSADVHPEKVKMMIAAVEKYGQYPLKEACYQKADEFKKLYYANLGEKLANIKPLEPAPCAGEDCLAWVCDDVMAGEITKVKDSVKCALAMGKSPAMIIQEGLGQGLSAVSEKYNREQVFLPELILAGEVFNRGIEALEDAFSEQEIKGRVVLGTIKGNVQESGMPIVSAMLKSSGYKVKEIGVNVDPETFIQEAKAFSADIIAVGVYVRLAWQNAQELITLIRRENLPYKMLTGGKGYKNEAEALEMGFDAFAEDGLDTVKKADVLMAAINQK